MITTNIDVAEELFNGAFDVFRHIELHNGLPKTIWIEFDDTIVGLKDRSNRKEASFALV